MRTALWILAATAGLAIVLRLWRGCAHPSPLSLLPPTVDTDGVRQPSRWFCDRCGREWPATFDHSGRRIPKFTGYDPTKAPAAAKRARQLQARAKAAHLVRAGFGPRRPRRPATITRFVDRKAAR